jgi:hypothetical protein
MTIFRFFASFLTGLALTSASFAQQAPAPAPPTGNISGTVTDGQDAVIPGAVVVLAGPASDPRSVTTSDTGAFDFAGIAPGTYTISVRAQNYATWQSQTLDVQPDQFIMLPTIRLILSGGVTSVTVYASPIQLATQQVRLEEQQRVLGFVPNFYVVYDAHPAPLTTKLKYSLALHAETDPVNFAGAALLAGMQQAGDTPDYREGASGYAQRFGADYTTAFADVLMGGAVLPSLLHQDPRYFYKGTGTTRSRLFHALAAPFICKGDNGRWQPNYSSIGGDAAAGSLAEAYAPSTNRDAGTFLQYDLVATGGRMTNAIIQEFILRGFTTHSKDR